MVDQFLNPCLPKGPKTFMHVSDWHSCLVCQKTAKFHCFCCPNAVCGCCINAVEFAPVRGKKGFCNNCLKLVLLVEQNVDYDSDGVCIGTLLLLKSSGSLFVAICSISPG